MYMGFRLRREYREQFSMVFVFANTGQENEETLRFVERCQREWKLDVVWVEAVVHHDERVSSTHRIVDFLSASRAGEPFEEVIKKYGIPNVKQPHCTRELKSRTIRSYVRSLGWDEYLTAIGIRSDEPKRINPQAAEHRFVYPLAHWFPIDKPGINQWWEEQPFDLSLQDYQGNCVWCWKKSLAKHLRLIKENPQAYDFPRRMEATYGDYVQRRTGLAAKHTFFRESRSTTDLFAIAATVTVQSMLFDRADEDSGCSESCEAF